MPLAEFSEAQFECSATYELCNDPKGDVIFFKPSTRLEGSLGYDVALYTNYFGTETRQNLRENNLYQSVDIDSDRIPDIFVNTFIQFKRPYAMCRTPRNTERKEIWRSFDGQYFYFDINQTQNTILSRLEKSTGDRSIVTYASPCFYTFPEYYDHLVNKNLVNNTHFVGPQYLINHNSYGYKSHDGFGIGFSIPEKIEFKCIKEEIKKKLNKFNRSGGSVKELSGDLYKEFSEYKKIIDREQKRNKIYLSDQINPDDEVFYACLITKFLQSKGISWLIASLE